MKQKREIPFNRTSESAAYQRVWRRLNPRKAAAHSATYRQKTPFVVRKGRQLRAQYGPTLEDLARMFDAQGGKCALCERPFVKMPHVDHSHFDGHVRGLLCAGCNSTLGRLELHGIGWWTRLVTYLLTK